MTNKYFDGVVPVLGELTDLERELQNFALGTVKEFTLALEDCRIADAMTAVLDLAKRSNKYIDETAPWTLAKDEAQRAYLGTVIYHLLECIRFLAGLFAPAMPEATQSICTQLQPGCDAEAMLVNFWAAPGQFGGLEPGTKVTERPQALFARLDAEKIMKDGEEG